MIMDYISPNLIGCVARVMNNCLFFEQWEQWLATAQWAVEWGVGSGQWSGQWSGEWAVGSGK